MTINIEYETDKPLDVDYEKVANDIIPAALDYEKCPYEAEVNLILTDNDAIQEINRDYRQIDRPTDVLSFPMIDFEKESDFSHVEEAVEDYFNPETGELILGDIIVSVEKVIEQAEKYGHSRERELAFLIAHSMLHLCGYDHMTEEEAKELIENVNLVVSVDYVYSSTVEAGKVVKYSPSGTVTEGTTVTIEVSRGKQVTKATVPNVIGMTESLANQSIEAAGLKVSVKYETSSKASYGTVTSQTPYSGGDTVESGTTITIYVSHYTSSTTSTTASGSGSSNSNSNNNSNGNNSGSNTSGNSSGSNTSSGNGSSNTGTGNTSN